MLTPNVIFIAPCQLAFVRKTGPYATSSAAAWSVVLDWLAARGHDVIDNAGFGIALDDPRETPQHRLRYDACVRKPATFSPADDAVVRIRHFEGGAYFITRHVGCYSLLGGIVSEARDVLVPRQGLIHDLSRPVLTINYSYPSQTLPEAQTADVCIPVVPDRRMTERDEREKAQGAAPRRR